MRRAKQIAVDRARARQVIFMLSGALDVTVEGILDGSSRPETSARHIAFYIAHASFGMSLARVAAAFGRDRSSVAAACKVLEDRRDDPAFDRWMDALERSAAIAPKPALSTVPFLAIAPPLSTRLASTKPARITSREGTDA